MRKKARIDANQPLITNALRRIGATVNITSGLGDGFPDLLVSFRGEWFVIEIKDGEKPPSKQKLTADEIEFLLKQDAPVYVINSVKNAIRLLTDRAYRGKLNKTWWEIKNGEQKIQTRANRRAAPP